MDRILKILKKENGPRASSAPALELNTIIFKHVYWYMQQISGERLQDHWSSGLKIPDSNESGFNKIPLYIFNPYDIKRTRFSHHQEVKASSGGFSWVSTERSENNARGHSEHLNGQMSHINEISNNVAVRGESKKFVDFVNNFYN